MSNKITLLTATIILFILFWTALLSMSGTSLTFDELAHIPAGYSYLTQRDYRVNPEHPQLIKDLAAVPLLFKNLNFPVNDPVWTQEESAPPWWVQFDLGTKFIYQSGNNPRDIIFWARFPMILLLVFIGWLVFKSARDLGGNYVGLGALILLSFSPTFIAHGRIVATDMGAALGAVLGLFYWLKFLKNPKPLNVFCAGLILGIVMLIKFSLILLIPVFVIITITYPLLLEGNKISNLKKYLLKACISGIVALVLIIWPVYQFHVSNYPIEHQIRDTQADLAPNKIIFAKNLTIWMAQKPALRPIAQYFRGILMATQRVSFGNTTYFLGKISAESWHSYFPILYLLKTPLALNIFALIVILGIIYLYFKKRKTIKLFKLIKDNFTVFSIFVFLFIYWTTAILGNLNIGIRHLLPTFPFIYILTMLGLKELFLSFKKLKKILIFTTAVLFIWYISSSLFAFPHYISYYNEATGGSKNGYKWAVDSNYDWGQDFYRLYDFIKTNKINKIYLDYFGGENPSYWLEDKYIKLNPKEIKIPPKGWVAVSVNQLQGGLADPVKEFDQQTKYYNWLSNETPVAKAGYSIFIYNIQ